MTIPLAPDLQHRGRVVLVELHEAGLDLEVVALEFTTEAHILWWGRELRRVEVGRA
jgi:hypothetical protein